MSANVIEQSVYNPGYGLDGPGFKSCKNEKIFLFSGAHRPTLGLIGLFFSGYRDSLSVVKRLERGVDHFTPSSAENEFSCTSSPPVWHGYGQLYLTSQDIGVLTNVLCV
jgi:hypothetical protein